MKMVKYVKKQNEMNDHMLYDCNSKVNMLKKNGVKISSKDMHIALKRNNAQPLIKGIYSQMKNEKINFRFKVPLGNMSVKKETQKIKYFTKKGQYNGIVRVAYDIEEEDDEAEEIEV